MYAVGTVRPQGFQPDHHRDIAGVFSVLCLHRLGHCELQLQVVATVQTCMDSMIGAALRTQVSGRRLNMPDRAG